MMKWGVVWVSELSCNVQAGLGITVALCGPVQSSAVTGDDGDGQDAGRGAGERGGKIAESRGSR